MHIDHNQFLELLADTSGIEAEKVKKQVAELIEEINQAVADGEAYEIDGFGIFSGIGDRVLFIPSKDLETEINFKYVGMEPIELEEDQVKKEEKTDEDPFSDLQDLDSDEDSKRDPFAGLVEEFDEKSIGSEEHSDEELIFGVDAKKKLDHEDEEFKPGPEEWGIEAHREDDEGANNLLSSLMGEGFSERNIEEDQDLEPIDDSTFDDIFGEEIADEDSQAEESVSGLDAELSNLMAEETSIIPTDEMDAGLLDDDIFGELENEVYSEVEEIEKKEPEEELEVVEEALDEVISESDEENKPDHDLTTAQEDQTEGIDMDDFDDPFLDLENELLEEEVEDEPEDIVPVITNISSGIEPKKKEEVQPEKKQKDKPLKPKKDSAPTPVWLYIVLVFVILTGTTLGLGYFSIINIPGITPQVASNVTIQPVTPPVQSPVQPEPPQQEEDATAQNPPPPPILEQEEVVEVPVSNSTAEVPSEQNKYGLNGVVNADANDGYTIVLYSLSVEANAFVKQKELTEEGYRALVTPIASERYGTLWRVSIGQFPSLTDAAIASENMDAKLKQSYFIKRIIN